MDAEGVRRVARLARLRLTVDEEEALARDLGTILDHFRALEGVAGEERAAPPAGVLRDDAVAVAAPEVVDRILEAVPRREGRRIRVPRGVGE